MNNMIISSYFVFKKARTPSISKESRRLPQYDSLTASSHDIVEYPIQVFGVSAYLFGSHPNIFIVSSPIPMYCNNKY